MLRRSSRPARQRHRPRVLFVDEPTGNLDGETSELVQGLLFDLNREVGTSLVIVTHDLELAQRADQMIRLARGALVADEPTSSAAG